MESNQARNPEALPRSEDGCPLDEVTCLVCVHSAKELDCFLAWLAAKGAAEAPMLRRLKEAYGLCPITELESFSGGHGRDGEPVAEPSWWRAIERFVGRKHGE